MGQSIANRSPRFDRNYKKISFQQTAYLAYLSNYPGATTADVCGSHVQLNDGAIDTVYSSLNSLWARGWLRKEVHRGRGGRYCRWYIV